MGVRDEALRIAEQQRRAARERSPGSLSLNAGWRSLATWRRARWCRAGIDPELSVLLATEAAQIEPTAQADEALRAALLRTHGIAVVGGGEDRIGKATFSPDGRWVLATTGPVARIYPADGGAHVVELGKHAGRVNDAAFSPDGRRVLTASADGTVRIWEAATGRCTAVLCGHQGGVNSVAFQADGTTIRPATMGRHGSGRPLRARFGARSWWQVQPGPFGLRPTGEAQRVRRVAFSQGDGRLLFTLSGHAATSQIARVWDVDTGRWLSEGRGMVALGVREAAFSPDGALVAAAWSSGGPEVWSATASSQVTYLQTPNNGTAHGVAFSPDGSWLVESGDDPTVRIWNTKTWTRWPSFAGTPTSSPASRSARTGGSSSRLARTGRRGSGRPEAGRASPSYGGTRPRSSARPSARTAVGCSRQVRTGRRGSGELGRIAASASFVRTSIILSGASSCLGSRCIMTVCPTRRSGRGRRVVLSSWILVRHQPRQPGSEPRRDDPANDGFRSVRWCSATTAGGS